MRVVLAVVALLAITSPGSAGEVHFGSGVGIYIGTCHTIVLTGPETRVKEYKARAAERFEATDEATLARLATNISVRAVFMSGTSNECARSGYRPERLVFTERQKGAPPLLTIEFEVETTELANAMGATSQFHLGSAELPVSALVPLAGRDLTVFFIHSGGRYEEKWGKNRTEKVLKP